MFYFIPAWYHSDKPWQYMAEVWYCDAVMLDDTISQLRMFEQAGQSNQLLVLSYHPQLRYFLHRYGLYEVSYWSVFDAIQGITDDKDQRLVDYKTLNWPVGSEFIHSPFLVLVRYQGRQIGRVEFGSDGQVLFVDYTEQQDIEQRYLFDDRGFVSSCIYSREGVALYQDYFNRQGQWQIRHHLRPNEEYIEIHPSQRYRFNRDKYASLAELIQEVLTAYLADTLRQEDTVVLASHSYHNQMVQAGIGQSSLILSYCQERYSMREDEENVSDMVASSLIVVDSLSLQATLQAKTETPVIHLSPFDTRLMLGKSQRLKEQMIYFLLDGLSAHQLITALEQVASIMASHSDVTLRLVTYQKGEAANQYRQQVSDWLASRAETYLFLAEEESVSYEVLEEEKPASRVSYTSLQTERDILQVLEKARLIVDVSASPHLYTQIAGISTGIPQINLEATEFVEHLKNGYVLHAEDELEKALAYYLTGLRNWNQALVYAVKKLTDYTSGKLVQKIVTSLEEHGKKREDIPTTSGN